jgi:hypothetical protein
MSSPIKGFSMTHYIKWLIPDHVIMATLDGPITADEVQQIADEMYNTIATASTATLVHTLVDVRDATMQDKVWSYAKLNFKRHPTNGWSIVIGDSRLAGLVVAIFSKILNLHIRYSETLETALKVLGEHHVVVAEYLEQ